MVNFDKQFKAKAMSKSKKVVKTQIAGKEQNQPAPETVKKLDNEPTATEKANEYLEGSAIPTDKPSATASIPPVKDKVEEPNVSVDEMIKHEVHPSEMELALGEMDNVRSMKFKIDPDTVKAPMYAQEDFRGFFQEYLEEKEVKPNVLIINTDSLERLGYRDTAVDLGVTIKESTVYKKTELLLALDF